MGAMELTEITDSVRNAWSEEPELLLTHGFDRLAWLHQQKRWGDRYDSAETVLVGARGLEPTLGHSGR